MATSTSTEMLAVTRRRMLFLLLIAFAMMLPGFAFAAGEAEYGFANSGNLTVESAGEAQNARGKASSATVFRYGWSNGKSHSIVRKTVKAYDVTGDALPDAVKFGVVRSESRAGMARAFSIAINGQLAWSCEEPSGDLDSITVSVLTLKSNVPFVFVSAYRADGPGRQELCRFNGSVLEPVVSNSLMAAENVSDVSISSARPAGNKVVLNFEFVSSVTGLSRTSFSYVYRNGSLQRSSDESSALRYATTASGGYTRKALALAKRTVAYDDPSLQKRAFSMRKGKKARPLAVRLQDGKLVYKVRYGKREGWIACPDGTADGGAPLLKGAYGKVALEPEPPTPSARTAMSASDLQRYSNHALFLARNELFARKGAMFESDELAGYFATKNWYVPNESSQAKLSAAGNDNALLMLSIEKNRNSPYVA